MKSQLPSRDRALPSDRLVTTVFCTLALLAASVLPALAQDRHAVSKVAPVYPPMAKQMHITGVVKVIATVDATGKVIKAESPSGNKILALAATDCVKMWKFAPGDGVTTVTIDVDFEI
jgi:TonB family protein